MRQVFLEKGAITLKEICQPALEKDSVLVSVHYSFISSGTESATINNAQQNVLFTNIPQKIAKVLESIATNGIEGTKALIRGRLASSVQSLGYSISGRVIAVGSNVKKIRTGDYVACAGAGYANHADVVCVPENLTVVIPDPALLREASLTTIGAIALQGVRRAQLQLNETVAVIGLGLIGQITVQLLKQSGCKVVGIDILNDRLELALKMGADFVFNAGLKQVNKEIEFLTEHYGVDCTIITAASKSDAIVQQAMEITRKKGKVVVVGDVGLALQRAPFYQKEIDLLISCSYGPGRYDSSYEQNGNDYPFPYVRWTENRNMQAFVDLLHRKQLDVQSLISDCVPVDKVQEGYDLLQTKNCLGVVLSYLPKDDAQFVPKSTVNNTQVTQDITTDSGITFIPATKTTLRVGVVGAGGFAKIKLMPIIARMKNVSINAIVDADMSNSINVSRLYGVAKALNDDKDLFIDDLVDTVIIASPHKYHCDQALNALRHGKAVFMEKPMVTDFEQFSRLSSFLKKNPNVPFCVDYNRSFAPFVLKIKETIASRKSPLIVHYRMNAGFIPKEHWVQTEVGAGRIVGEACHIFDLFCALTGSHPVAVSVESLKPSSDDLFPTDNFSAQISFYDGSVCTLLYTSLGHADLGKERMELFYDSKCIVMDDFKVLQGYGLPASFNQKVNTGDKGHEYVLKTFLTNLQIPNAKPLISLERLNTVAELTLIIDQLACQGGGARELA